MLTILDMSARAKYVMDVEEITPAIVETFVNDFLAESSNQSPSSGLWPPETVFNTVFSLSSPLPLDFSSVS